MFAVHDQVGPRCHRGRVSRPKYRREDDELGELARSFNAMLEALALSRAQQHRLVADGGGELWTPLTSIGTNIELLARAESDNDLPS